ncbi:RidA family protein [Eubacteriales bacterium OttesenSCG-928-N13]|nr:RidA family protein [Eubacteriales bacterium OttesenSCG-928-N13]
MSKKIIHTDNAPKAVGPYVQAIDTGKLLFTSGQLGIDPMTGKLLEGVEAQAEQSMKNVGAILKEVGADFKDAVKCTIFVQDMNDFAAVNKIYESFFDGNFPARSCVQVAKLPLGGLVEIECIAQL